MFISKYTNLVLLVSVWRTVDTLTQARIHIYIQKYSFVWKREVTKGNLHNQ